MLGQLKTCVLLLGSCLVFGCAHMSWTQVGGATLAMGAMTAFTAVSVSEDDARRRASPARAPSESDDGAPAIGDADAEEHALAPEPDDERRKKAQFPSVFIA